MMRMEVFGVLPGGQPVNQYTLTNETGMTVKILNYGGIIREIRTPDRDGNLGNCVLFYDTLEDYAVNPAFIGAAIGRTAGRIGGGRLAVWDSSYEIPQNNGKNTLHGGPCGFHHKPMEASFSETTEAMILSLGFVSEDGECGYPGRLELELKFTLMKGANVFVIDFVGASSRKTYLNMTHHGYFNLSGRDTTIEEHILQLSADAYAPVDEAMLPLIGWAPVQETPFDFQKPGLLKGALRSGAAQISLARGIDHPFRLWPKESAHGEAPCVILKDPASGRCMKVATTHPHMVMYTGNFLDAAEVPSGKIFQRYQGICFEAQEVPNAPGNPAFECRYLEAGEAYRHSIRYEFSVE